MTGKKLFSMIVTVSIFLCLLLAVSAGQAEGGNWPDEADFNAWYEEQKAFVATADHYLGPGGDINETNSFYSIIMPGETVAILPNISIGQDSQRTTFGGTIYQLDDPRVVTEVWYGNLLPHTGTPKTTSLTAVERVSVHIPYAARASKYSDDGVLSVPEDSPMYVEYVRLYRNDTGHPIVMCGKNYGDLVGETNEVRFLGKCKSVAYLSDNRFSGSIAITSKPQFWIVEKEYKMSYAAYVEDEGYIWPEDAPLSSFPDTFYLDGKDHTYVFPNPMKEGLAFFYWQPDRDHYFSWFKGYMDREHPINNTGVTGVWEGNTYKLTVNAAKFFNANAEDLFGFFQDFVFEVGFEKAGDNACYTLAFDPNGGTINGRDSYFCEAVDANYQFAFDVSTVVPVWEGHEFMGWCTDPGKAAATLITDPTPANAWEWYKQGHTQLYAVWDSLEGGVLPGDVNSDGVVDGRDVVRFMHYLADEIDPETDELYEINETNADLNGDERADEKDLLQLVKKLAGEV